MELGAVVSGLGSTVVFATVEMAFVGARGRLCLGFVEGEVRRSEAE